ncbi:MAG: thioredoxin [Proteobacteria bacterium]|nr:MAG: thioredoxin [Pseudomonadota bacterium]
MKRELQIWGILLLATTTHASVPAMVGPDLTGEVSKQTILGQSYPWMKDIPEHVSLDTPKTLSQVDVEVYFGSWCGDSHEFLPQFMDLIDRTAKKSGVHPKSIRYFGLDRKKSFEGYVNTRSIERIPTFIFLKDGKEIGRIVETPKKTISSDVQSILSARR